MRADYPIRSRSIAIIGFWLDDTRTKECELIKSGHTSGLLAVNYVFVKLLAAIFWIEPHWNSDLAKKNN